MSKCYAVKYRIKSGEWIVNTMDLNITRTIEEMMQQIIRKTFTQNTMPEDNQKTWCLWANGKVIEQKNWKQRIMDINDMMEADRLVIFCVWNEELVEKKINVVPVQLTPKENLLKLMIMQRNGEECLKAHGEKSANERRRILMFNPTVPEAPESADLALVLFKLGKQFKELQSQTINLANQLLDDAPADQMHVNEFVEKQNNIQNYMDAIRYLSVELQYLAAFGIPLKADPPRKLFIVGTVEFVKK